MQPSHSPRANSSRLDPAHLAAPADQPDRGTPTATPGRPGPTRAVAFDPAAGSPADNGPAGARLPAGRPSWARPAHSAAAEPFPVPPPGDEPHRPAEPAADARTVSREGWLEEPALGEHAMDDLEGRSQVSTAALAGTPRPDTTGEEHPDDTGAERPDDVGTEEPDDAGTGQQGTEQEIRPGPAAVIERTAVAYRAEVAYRPARTGPRFAAERPGGVDEPVAAVGGRRPGDVTASTATLWSEESARQLRAEWQAVAARFIDEPHEALDAAQTLVSRAVRELADALLAEQGDADPRRLAAQPDTEAMRMAMRGYREFLDRILAL